MNGDVLTFSALDQGLYLAHHGTKGQKWGRRRFQNPDGSLTPEGKRRYYGRTEEVSSKQFTKDLNKVDQTRAQAKANWDYYGKKLKKRIRKEILSEKHTVNDPNGKKRYVPSAKVTKLTNKVKGYENIIDSSYKISKHIIKKAEKQGYTVSSKNVKRSVNVGRTFATSILSAAGAIATSSIFGVGIVATRVQYAPGKKYKVRNQEQQRRYDSRAAKKNQRNS